MFQRSAMLSLIGLILGSWTVRSQVAAPTQQVDSRSLLKRVVQLEREKQYPEAAEILREYLRRETKDQLARCLLIDVYVRTQRKSDALEEFASLKQSAIPPKLVPVASKLETIVQNFELERSVDKALLAFKAEEAAAIVDRMFLNPQQKELLKYYIDLRQGNLASALMRSMRLQRAGAEGPAESDRRGQVTDNAALFSKIQQRIDWYRYSALTNGSCTSNWIREEIPKQHYEIQHEFMDLIANSQKQFPLSPWVLDHAFFATLLSDRPYEDLESFGDSILEAKGTLRVPFYSRDALFDLVIDSRARHIRTEPDAHLELNESGTEGIPTLLSFDIPFDQLKEIDQSASTDLASGALTKGAYALRFDPSGLAPRYAFMDAIQCLDGEAKQKTVTRNLGRFIAHVVNNGRIKVHFVDPQHKTVDWMRGASTVIAVGTVVGAQAVNVANNGNNTVQADAVSQQAMKVLAQNKADSADEKRISLAQDQERQFWHEELAHLIFSEIEAQSTEVLVNGENQLLAIADAAAVN